MDNKKTARGFDYSEFDDLYGSKCSIQKSSLAMKDAIWFGVDCDFNEKQCTRMHLDRKQVFKLLPALIKFWITGDI